MVTRLKSLSAQAREENEKIDLLARNFTVILTELRTLKEEYSIKLMNAHEQSLNLALKLQITNEQIAALGSNSKVILHLLNRSPWIVRQFPKLANHIIKATAKLIHKKSRP